MRAEPRQDLIQLLTTAFAHLAEIEKEFALIEARIKQHEEEVAQLWPQSLERAEKAGGRSARTALYSSRMLGDLLGESAYGNGREPTPYTTLLSARLRSIAAYVSTRHGV